MMLRRRPSTMGNSRSATMFPLLLLSVLAAVLSSCSAATSSGVLKVENLVKSEPAAPVFQQQASVKPQLKGSTRRTQDLILDDGSDNSSSAYLKCYRTIDEVAPTTMDQQAFLEFLQSMTDGNIAVNNWSELPAVYVMIFYTAACTEDGDCVGDNVPEIEIGDTNDPSPRLQLFCKHILKNTETVAEAAFEYSIRYDPTTLDEDALANCLAVATVNILLERLTECMADGRRNLMMKQDLQDTFFHLSPSWETKYKSMKQNDRALQALGGASSGDIDCEYKIDATVDRITESGESSTFFEFLFT